MTISSRSPGRPKNGLAPSGGGSGALPEPGVQLTRHLVILGRVQGVWYRESMRLEAERLGVTGWVRNRRDGAVEAVVQGDEGAVESIIAWARTGPPAARVEDMSVTPAEGTFTGFERLPTA